MRLLDWKEDFSTGVAAADADHRELIGAINRLYDEFDDPDHPRDAAALIADVLGAVAAHFSAEEELMRSRSYAGLEPHKQDHDRLLDELNDMMEAFAGADEPDSVELSLRLEPWFARHFHSHDAAMIQAIGAH
jgi:hemerythrin